MVKLWAFGWLQLIISAVADPLMLIWSFFSLGALINVILYDTLVLGISFDDAMNYDPAYTIEGEYNDYRDLDDMDAKVVNVDFGMDDDETTNDDDTNPDTPSDETP